LINYKVVFSPYRRLSAELGGFRVFKDNGLPTADKGGFTLGTAKVNTFLPQWRGARRELQILWKSTIVNQKSNGLPTADKGGFTPSKRMV
jgi:hypothetical protein